MTTTPSGGQSEPQWQQPEFQPEPPPYAAPLEGQIYSGQSGQELVPRPVYPPPSVPETVIRTISGLMWPVMIVLAISGVIGWWPAIIILIATNVVLENVRRHLRAQRRAIAARENQPGDPEDGLR